MGKTIGQCRFEVQQAIQQLQKNTRVDFEVADVGEPLAREPASAGEYERYEARVILCFESYSSPVEAAMIAADFCQQLTLKSMYNKPKKRIEELEIEKEALESEQATLSQELFHDVYKGAKERKAAEHRSEELNLAIAGLASEYYNLLTLGDSH